MPGVEHENGRRPFEPFDRELHRLTAADRGEGRRHVLAHGTVEHRRVGERLLHEVALVDRAHHLGRGEPVELAVTRLEGAPAVLVVDAGHPIGVLSRSDVLEFLARSAP